MKIARYPLVLAGASAALSALACLVAANLLPERRDLQQPVPHHLAAIDNHPLCHHRTAGSWRRGIANW